MNIAEAKTERDWRVGHVSVERSSKIGDHDISDDLITWQDKLFTAAEAEHEVAVANQTEARHNLHPHPDMRTRWIARMVKE